MAFTLPLDQVSSFQGMFHRLQHIVQLNYSEATSFSWKVVFIELQTFLLNNVKEKYLYCIQNFSRLLLSINFFVTAEPYKPWDHYVTSFLGFLLCLDLVCDCQITKMAAMAAILKFLLPLFLQNETWQWHGTFTNWIIVTFTCTHTKLTTSSKQYGYEYAICSCCSDQYLSPILFTHSFVMTVTFTGWYSSRHKNVQIFCCWNKIHENSHVTH